MTGCLPVALREQVWWSVTARGVDDTESGTEARGGVSQLNCSARIAWSSSFVFLPKLKRCGCASRALRAAGASVAGDSAGNRGDISF
mgnify:CR=1 FL=1|jgi:hypothetical protein